MGAFSLPQRRRERRGGAEKIDLTDRGDPDATLLPYVRLIVPRKFRMESSPSEEGKQTLPNEISLT